MQIELSIYPGNEMAVVNKLFKRCIEVDYRISYYQTHRIVPCGSPRMCFILQKALLMQLLFKFGSPAVFLFKKNVIPKRI